MSAAGRSNTASDKRSLFKDAISRFETDSDEDKSPRSSQRTQSRNTESKQSGKRRVLGRGLSALMSSTEVAVPVDEEEAYSSPQVAELTPEQVAPAKEIVEASSLDEQTSETSGDGLLFAAIDTLRANPDQPRKRFLEAEIASLAESISETGLLQPILVRPAIDDLDESYLQIVAGERRYRAALQAGLERVPVIRKDLTDQETLELGIIENVQRADLDPIEEAQAYQRLAENYGQTQAQIAKTVGKDRTSIANALRLLKLPEEVRRLVVEGTLSAGHARALLALDSPPRQKALAKKIVEQGLSVRAIERYVSDEKDSSAENTSSKRSKEQKPPIVVELEERIRRVLGTKVSLQMDKKGRGELKINFFSAEELEQLMEVLSA